MGGKKKYIVKFGSFTEPFNSDIRKKPMPSISNKLHRSNICMRVMHEKRESYVMHSEWDVLERISNKDGVWGARNDARPLCLPTHPHSNVYNTLCNCYTAQTPPALLSISRDQPNSREKIAQFHGRVFKMCQISQKIHGRIWEIHGNFTDPPAVLISRCYVNAN